MKTLLIIPILLCFEILAHANSQVVCLDGNGPVDETIVKFMEKVKKLGYNNITSITMKKDGSYFMICGIVGDDKK